MSAEVATCGSSRSRAVGVRSRGRSPPRPLASPDQGAAGPRRHHFHPHESHLCVSKLILRQQLSFPVALTSQDSTLLSNIPYPFQLLGRFHYMIASRGKNGGYPELWASISDRKCCGELRGPGFTAIRSCPVKPQFSLEKECAWGTLDGSEDNRGNEMTSAVTTLLYFLVACSSLICQKIKTVCN